MDAHGWTAIGVLVLATLLFITRWIPLAMTALSIPVVLHFAGVLPDARDAFVGFGNQAVLAIAAVMVLGASLRESGVATYIARGIQQVAGTGESGLICLMMITTGALSAFMNNAAVVAMLLPVTAVLSRRSGVSPSRLFLPMAVAAVLGGTITLIGSAPNLLMADYYNLTLDAPRGEMGMFDMAMIGVPLLLVGTMLMALVVRRLLPPRVSVDETVRGRSPEEAASAYLLAEKLYEMRVVKGSSVAGKSIEDANIRAEHGLGILAICRTSGLGRSWLQPHPSLIIEPEDRLFIEGPDEAAWEFAETEVLQLGLASEDTIRRVIQHGTVLGEVALSPHAPVLGLSLREVGFRRRHHLNVVGLWRYNQPVRERFEETPLQIGDALLVAGTLEDLATLSMNSDYIVLTDHRHDEDVTRAPMAMGILALALLPPVLFGLSFSMSALGAALLMVATGCIAHHRVLRSIDWGVLALIVGTLPLGVALERQGISESVAAWFQYLPDVGGGIVVYAALFLLAAVLAILTTNAASAVIVAPVAAAVATVMDLDPKRALLAMTFGCSCNFLLPFMQCNLLVLTPGGYRTKDYLKVGGVMSIVMAITVILLLAFGVV